MRAFAVRRGENHPDLAGCILCHDVPGLFRKGHILRAEDVPLLIDASWSEIHLIELGPRDVAQREAGERLARMLAAPGLEIAPAGHRHVLRAAQKGLLQVDVAALRRLNAIGGVAVFTLRNDAVVAERDAVAEAQITPLAIDSGSLEEAEATGSILQLLPFQPRDVVLWTRDQRMLRTLVPKLRWFGCELREVLDPSHFREQMPRRNESLFIVNGANALDPLDPVFLALDAMGATMRRIGMPVHPGTLLWIATWNDATIIGLPSCGRGEQMTAFDLVLPQILATGTVRAEDMGHGGLLQHARAMTLSSLINAEENESVR